MEDESIPKVIPSLTWPIVRYATHGHNWVLMEKLEYIATVISKKSNTRDNIEKSPWKIHLLMKLELQILNRKYDTLKA